MKSLPRLIALVLLGLAGVAGALGLLSRLLANREPEYEGRPLEAWVADLGRSNNVVVSSNAQRVIRDLVVPRLTHQMAADTNDLAWRVKLVDLLDQLPGFNVNFLTADSRRLQAVVQIGQLGPAARTAVPALLAALGADEEMLYSTAATALVQVGAPAETAVPALLARTVSARGEGRPEVVEALGEYGPAARAAVPTLIRLLKDHSSKEIVFATPRALKKVDPVAAARAGVK